MIHCNYYSVDLSKKMPLLHILMISLFYYTACDVMVLEDKFLYLSKEFGGKFEVYIPINETEDVDKVDGAKLHISNYQLCWNDYNHKVVEYNSNGHQKASLCLKYEKYPHNNDILDSLHHIHLVINKINFFPTNDTLYIPSMSVNSSSLIVYSSSSNFPYTNKCDTEWHIPYKSMCLAYYCDRGAQCNHWNLINLSDKSLFPGKLYESNDNDDDDGKYKVFKRFTKTYEDGYKFPQHKFWIFRNNLKDNHAIVFNNSRLILCKFFDTDYDDYAATHPSMVLYSIHSVVFEKDEIIKLSFHKDYAAITDVFTKNIDKKRELIFSCDFHQFAHRNRICLYVNFYRLGTDDMWITDNPIMKQAMLASQSPCSTSSLYYIPNSDTPKQCYPVIAEIPVSDANFKATLVRKMMSITYENIYMKELPNDADFALIQSTNGSSINGCQPKQVYKDNLCNDVEFLRKGIFNTSLYNEKVFRNTKDTTSDLIAIRGYMNCEDDAYYIYDKCFVPYNGDNEDEEYFKAHFSSLKSIDNQEARIVESAQEFERFEITKKEVDDSKRCKVYESISDNSCKYTIPLMEVKIDDRIGYMHVPFYYSNINVFQQDYNCKPLNEILFEGECVDVVNINEIDIDRLNAKNRKFNAVYGIISRNIVDNQQFIVNLEDFEAKQLIIYEESSNYRNNCKKLRHVMIGSNCSPIQFIDKGLTSELEVFYLNHNYIGDWIYIDYPCGLSEVLLANYEGNDITDFTCSKVTHISTELNDNYTSLEPYLQYYITKSNDELSDNFSHHSTDLKIKKSLSTRSIVFHSYQINNLGFLRCAYGEVFVDEKCLPVLYMHQVLLKEFKNPAILYSKHVSTEYILQKDSPCRIYEVEIRFDGKSKCFDANIVNDIPSDLDLINLHGSLVISQVKVDKVDQSVLTNDANFATQVRISNENYPIDCHYDTLADSCEPVYYYEKVLMLNEFHRQLFTPYPAHDATKFKELACSPLNVLSFDEHGATRCLPVKNTFERLTQQTAFYSGQFGLTATDRARNIYDVIVDEANAEFAFVQHEVYTKSLEMCQINQAIIDNRCIDTNFIRLIKVSRSKFKFEYIVYTKFPTKFIESYADSFCSPGMIYIFSMDQCHFVSYLMEEERNLLQNLQFNLVAIPVRNGVNINDINQRVKVDKNFADLFLVTNENQAYRVPLVRCDINQAVFNSICQHVTYFVEFPDASRPYRRYTDIPQKDGVLDHSNPCPPGYMRFLDVEQIVRNCIKYENDQMAYKRRFEFQFFDSDYQESELSSNEFMAITISVAVCASLLLLMILVCLVSFS